MNLFFILLFSILCYLIKINRASLMAEYKFSGNTDCENDSSYNPRTLRLSLFFFITSFYLVLKILSDSSKNPTLTTDLHGFSDQAYLFDGVKTYIDLPLNISYNIGDVTISVWFKPLYHDYSYDASAGNTANHVKCIIGAD